jgi:alkyl hydroperoxide reductase subunit AhpC
VCPTEIIAFSDRKKDFDALNAKVIAISTDTEEVHLAWTQMPRRRGGLGHMQIPLVADTTKAISADYGVLIQEGPASGIAMRGMFLIDPEGVLKQITVNNLSVGRSVDETLRLLAAYQFVAKHGQVCPAGWKPGDKAMYGDPERSQEYFASGATETEEEDMLEPSEKMVVIGSKQDYLDVLKEPKAVIDFVAPWCGKCKQIFPLVRELSEAYPAITFAKFDTTEPALEELSAELGVQALPAFHFLVEGKEAREPIMGYKKKMLSQAVEDLQKM